MAPADAPPLSFRKAFKSSRLPARLPLTEPVMLLSLELRRNTLLKKSKLEKGLHPTVILTLRVISRTGCIGKGKAVIGERYLLVHGGIRRLWCQ